jgi:hypothetical protein
MMLCCSVLARHRGAEMTEGEKEQIKMRAAFSNGIGLAVVAVGGLAPTVALMTKEFDRAIVIRGALICIAGILAGTFFHARALYILDEIDNPLDLRRVKRQNVLLFGLLIILALIVWGLSRFGT